MTSASQPDFGNDSKHSQGSSKSKSVASKLIQTSTDDSLHSSTPEPFYPIPPPPDPLATTSVPNPVFHTHPDFSASFSSEPNFNAGDPANSLSSSISYQPPFRSSRPQEAHSNQGSSYNQWLGQPDETNRAGSSQDRVIGSEPSTSKGQSTTDSRPSREPEALPIARAQPKGSTYVPRVDRQHIGEAEHEQYKSKYAAEVRGLRTRIDELWGGSAWFTQQIVPGYGRAGSHDRVLYTIQQLARGSAGEGGEGGTYPERVRQAIEDAVHARLAEENKNRKSKRENLNLRAVVTTNDFKAAARALGCVSLRMPAGQPRKSRQTQQANGSSTKSSKTKPKRKSPRNRRASSDSASQSNGGEEPAWMPPVALSSVGSDPPANEPSLPLDHHPNSAQLAAPPQPPPLQGTSEGELKANRASLFAKYEADRTRKSSSSAPSIHGNFNPQGGTSQGGASSPSGSSNHSGSSSRHLFSTMNSAPYGGNYGSTSTWVNNGSRDSNERWNGNRIPSPNPPPQFGHSFQDRDSSLPSLPLSRRPSMEIAGPPLVNPAFHASASNGSMRPSPSPPTYASPMNSMNGLNGINGTAPNPRSIQNNGPSTMRSNLSPLMPHHSTSLASHSLSQMSSPQMRNTIAAEVSNSNGRVLPPLPSLSLPPMSSGGNSLPPLNWSLAHRKRGSEETLQDDPRDNKRGRV